MDAVKKNVENYYSEVLKSSDDLKTSACCVGSAPPEYLKSVIASISEDVLNKFYGCGFPISEAVENCTVLDLGCGTGRDVYIYSKLVGEDGLAIGIDMTDSQLETARNAEEWQMKEFGFAKSNVKFLKGFIEEIQETGIENNSVDIAVSNCVINLSSDKEKVISAVYKALKDGGEFYFSDVFTDRRLPENVVNDPVLYGECLGGALYINDFISLAKRCGFTDPRLIKEDPIDLDDSIKNKVGTASFVSRTYRLFKIAGLDDQCEDYGQTAIYKGTIPQYENIFILDDHHYFEKNRSEKVCANTAQMLSDTRFAKHFEISGRKTTHFSAFPCIGTTAYDLYKNKSMSFNPASKGSCC